MDAERREQLRREIIERRRRPTRLRERERDRAGDGFERPSLFGGKGRFLAVAIVIAAALFYFL
jgi:hypothetical protein